MPKRECEKLKYAFATFVDFYIEGWCYFRLKRLLKMSSSSRLKLISYLY